MRYPRDPSPDNRKITVTAALSAVKAIDQSNPRQVDAHVAAFLCAAWPTLQAQNQ